jgi:hypothetical protein
MVELGLKLEELLTEKGLENKVTCSFVNEVGKEKPLPQNSAKAPAINNPIDTRKEIANFANTSHDTVMKVKYPVNYLFLKIKVLTTKSGLISGFLLGFYRLIFTFLVRAFDQ